eukprot:1189782-Prorocentrum_minimum.AAC.4
MKKASGGMGPQKQASRLELSARSKHVVLPLASNFDIGSCSPVGRRGDLRTRRAWTRRARTGWRVPGE